MSDLTGRCFVKRRGAFIPADEAAREFADSVPENREVILSARKPRSPQHHRYFFAMLRLVVENTDGPWQTEDELLDALKLATGHVEQQADLSGVVYRRPKSISFAAMPEAEFKAFKERCLRALTEELGWDPVALMDEVDRTQRRAG